MEKTLKLIAGIALAAALTFGAANVASQETASTDAFTTQSVTSDPGGGPGH